MAAPRMSVLLPLQEDRSTGELSAHAWMHGQQAPRDAYEVVVLASGLDPDLERRVRPLLTEHDRWVEAATPDEYEMFNLGARIARGEHLFLTEAHCVPEPDCLAVMLEVLESRGLPGARGESRGEPRGVLGRLEHEVYGEHLRPGADDDHWRKVLIHSLAIRRDVYLEVGGFPARYGDFSAWALAIALREAGHRLGFAHGSAVRHVYTGELGILAEHVRDFARGEMRYCREQPAGLRARYLDEAPEWTGRMASTRSGAAAALRAAVGARLASPWLAAMAAEHAAVVLAGPRATALWGGAVTSAWRARTAAGALVRRPSRAAYERFWEVTARAARRDYLAREDWAADSAPPAAARADLAAAEPGALIGFHGLEQVGGRPFRWTCGLAVVQLALEGAGTHRVEIGLLPLRRQRRLRITVDGRPLDAAGCELRYDGATLTVDGGGLREIGIVCPPWRPWRAGGADRRLLGVAVTSVESQPV